MTRPPPLAARRPRRVMLRAMAALAMAGWLGGGAVVSPALAQGGAVRGGAVGGSGQVEVLAEQGIEWLQGERLVIATGNASATRDDTTVWADRLVAAYEEQPGGGTEFVRLEAQGSVRITTPEHTAFGHTGVYDLRTGQFDLVGSPARLVTANEVLTAQERLTYNIESGIATATGGATIEQEGNILRAPTLIGRMVEGPNGEMTFSTIDGEGGVTIVTADETAYGSQGNYDANSGIATLSGSVKIERGDTTLTGARATYNMRTGVSTLSGSDGTGRARAVVGQDTGR